jgi:hypothetical protein
MTSGPSFPVQMATVKAMIIAINKSNGIKVAVLVNGGKVKVPMTNCGTILNANRVWRTVQKNITTNFPFNRVALRQPQKASTPEKD